jgi:hypothetical protein
MTKAQVAALNIVSLGLLPGLVAALGVFVTLRRRARG